MRKVHLRLPIPRGRGAHSAGSGGSTPGNGGRDEGGGGVATATRVRRPRSLHADALSGLERISGARDAGPRPSEQEPVPSRPPPSQERKLEAAGRVLVIGFVCFALWLLLDVHSLQRSAESSPLGARRTAALTALRPIGWIGNATGVAYLGDLVKEALGRPTGGPVVKSTPPVPVAAPRARSPQAPPAPAPQSPTPVPPAQPPLPQPTAANPLRVLAIGDSIGEDFGQSLVSKLGATGVVQATLDGKINTGLARPDYFDWPGELRTDVSRFHPDVVVAMIGANDNQSFLVGGRGVQFGTPEWIAAYTQRVVTMMDEVTAQGDRMLWVGMPVMPSAGFSDQMQLLNRIVESQAVVHTGVSYLDSWHVFVDSGGRYSIVWPIGPSARSRASSASGSAPDPRPSSGSAG
ncbi:MAG: DUF459 domain-containing protein [Actinobacteria bacterium]|nr:MAG: DUF459 domain-containing protein [Actinomycetota bacterium]